MAIYMEEATEGFMDMSVKPLRGVISESDIYTRASETIIISNPDAMEIDLQDNLGEFQTLMDEVDEVCEQLDEARLIGKSVPENVYRKITQLFNQGIPLEDLGITREELMRLRDNLL